MKHALTQSKSPRQGTSLSQRRPVTGPNGISLAPPTYGIDFVDRQQSTDAGMTIQRQVGTDNSAPGKQQQNSTGLPDRLKAGIESLSGMAMDDVRVHYNSSKPAQLQALAYTQGADIHIGPGQEQHLPHEAWHVVQQKQGRVRPTGEVQGVDVNNDADLEQEAQTIGEKAAKNHHQVFQRRSMLATPATVVQRAVGYEYELDGAVSERYGKPSQGGDGPVERLEKGEVIVDKGGFSVTADDIPLNQGGGSDVEIIIKEIDDRDPTGKDKLLETAKTLTKFLTDLGRKIQKEGPVGADQFGGPEDVFVYGAVDNGTLQSSVGMTMDVLSQFRSGKMGQYHEQQLSTMQNYNDPLRENLKYNQAIKAQYLRGYGANELAYTVALGVVEAQFPKLASWYQTELAGAMSVIVMPPVNARVNAPLPYPKSAAGAMLARTDFANMLKQLSGPARVHIQDSELWMRMLLQTITILAGPYINEPIKASDPVFPEGSIAPYGTQEVALQIKLKDWLPRMVGFAPKDTLTTENYPGEYGGQKAGKWLESLGGFGAQMDPGFTNDEGPRPIFEFRKQMRVPLEHLTSVMVGILELVHIAHRRR